MSITMVSPITQVNPKKPVINPVLPDPIKQKSQIDEAKKNQSEINKIKQDIDKSTRQINKSIEDTFEKTAQQICLLRLDMVADKLDKIYPKWASKIDLITNKLEKEWL